MILLSIRDSEWIVVWSADERGTFDAYASIDEWIDPLNTPACRCYYLKYEFGAARAPGDAGIDAIYIESDLEMASTSLPSLTVGPNRVEYRDDTRGPHTVRLWHGWHESSEACQPQPPARPISPSEGATVALAELVELVWEGAEDRDGEAIGDYHVQISARPDFLYPASPNLDRIIYSAEPRWALPQGWLVPDRRYYWRVRAQTQWGLWSGWSDAWSFESAVPGSNQAERSGTT